MQGGLREVDRSEFQNSAKFVKHVRNCVVLFPKVDLGFAIVVQSSLILMKNSEIISAIFTGN